MSDDLISFLWYVVGGLGVILAIILAGVVIGFIRKPLNQFLTRVLKDETVAKFGTTFVLVLIGLRGLVAVLGSVNQEHTNFLFNNLVRQLNGMVDDIQWVIYIAALFFIGYAIQGWKGHSEE